MASGFAAVVQVAMLAACSSLPQPAGEIKRFDLGGYAMPDGRASASSARQASSSAATEGDHWRQRLRVEVNALAPYDSRRFFYRQSHLDPQRLLAYRNSEWAAEPALMLAAKFNASLGLAQVSTGVTPCRLQITIAEWLQHFESDQVSAGKITLFVVLSTRESGQPALSFSRSFSAQSPRSDASGGATAIARAADQAIDQLRADLRPRVQEACQVN